MGDVVERRADAGVESIDIAQIEIGARRRRKVGKLARLAKSIEQHGLINPIIVTEDLLLVAGRRRLAACESLGWETIAVRRFESLSDDELREIELDENALRVDLDDYERSKERLREVEAKAEEFCAESAQNSGRGRPAGGTRQQSRASGVPESTIRATRRHVETAEQYPALQADGWKKYHVIEAGQRLEQIPEKDRATVVEMATDGDTPAQQAITVIRNVAAMPAARRTETLDLYRSGSKSKRAMARTRVEKNPLLPDARLMDLDIAVGCVEKAMGRRTDEHTRKMEKPAKQLRGIMDAIRESDQKYREKAMRG